MKALVLKGRGKIEYMSKPTPSLRDSHGAILKPILVSPCTSDVHTIWQGSPKRRDLTLGHECIAQVIKVGSDVNDYATGNIVAVPAITPDWNHMEAPTNLYHAGTNFSSHMLGKSIDGVFQELFYLPNADKNLAAIPKGMSLEAALMCVDVFATGLTAIQDSMLRRGDSIVVFGIGAIGLSVVSLSRIFGARKIYAVGSREANTSIAKAWGAEVINYKTCMCDLPKGMHPLSNSTCSSVVNYILQNTGTKGVDKAIICGGNDDILAQAVDVIKYGSGVIDNIMYYGSDGNPSNDFIRLPKFSLGRGMAGKTLRFSLSKGGRTHLENTLSFCKDNNLPTESLITKTYNGLENIRTAIYDMKEHRAIKVAVYV